MINVCVAESNTDLFVECCGHAGFSSYGTDIVCAGVSALCLSFMKAVKAFLKDSADITVAEGYFKFSLPNLKAQPFAVQLQSFIYMFISGLREICRLYPDNVSFNEDYLPLWVRYIDTPEQTADKSERRSK